MVSTYFIALLKNAIKGEKIPADKKSKLIKMINQMPDAVSFKTLRKEVESTIGYALKLEGTGNDLFQKSTACGKQKYCNENNELKRCNGLECPLYA